MPRMTKHLLPLALLAALAAGPPATAPATLPASRPVLPAGLPAARPAGDLDIPQANVLVPKAFVAKIEEAAVLAEAANVSGLAWKPYYLAYMRAQRRGGRWNPKEIDAIGLYFGAMQGYHHDALAARHFTPDEVAAIRAELDRRTAEFDKAAEEAKVAPPK